MYLVVPVKNDLVSLENMECADIVVWDKSHLFKNKVDALNHMEKHNVQEECGRPEVSDLYKFDHWEMREIIPE